MQGARVRSLTEESWSSLLYCVTKERTERSLEQMLISGPRPKATTPVPDPTVTICMNFTTAGPGKEGENWKNSEKVRRRKETAIHMSSQNPSCWNLSWLSDAWIIRKWLSQNDWPETNLKLIPSPKNLRLQATKHSSSPGFRHPAGLQPGAHSQSSVYLLTQFISNC